MKWEKGLWTVAILAFLLGFVGVYDRIVSGLMGHNVGSYVPWGLQVAGYIYLIGLSAGAFLLSTLVYVFNVKQLEKTGKLALLTALALLVGAMFAIWTDMGHPERAWSLALGRNLGSIMSWLIYLYTAYFLLLLVELWFAMRPDLVAGRSSGGLKGLVCQLLSFRNTSLSDAEVAQDRSILRILGAVGVPLAIVFHGGVGAIFAVVGARPFWNSGLTPVAFLVGALTSGGALLTAVQYLGGPNRGGLEWRRTIIFLGKIVLGLLFVDMLLELSDFIGVGYAAIPGHISSLNYILFGPNWWWFWGWRLIPGLLAPAALLIVGRNSPGMVALGSFLLAINFIAMRLNIVVPGQVNPEFVGLSQAFSNEKLHFDYFPSLYEWLFYAWFLSVALLVFLVGYRLLPVVEEKPAAKAVASVGEFPSASRPATAQSDYGAKNDD